jgi:hypothetical protein
MAYLRALKPDRIHCERRGITRTPLMALWRGLLGLGYPRVVVPH